MDNQTQKMILALRHDDRDLQEMIGETVYDLTADNHRDLVDIGKGIQDALKLAQGNEQAFEALDALVHAITGNSFEGIAGIVESKL